MAIIHWLNPVSGTWETTGDWSPAGLPGASDDVFIDATGATYVVTSTQDNAAATLTIGASATLAIGDGNPTFTTFTVNGGISNAGHLNVTDSATLNIAGAISNTGTIALQSPLFGF